MFFILPAFSQTFSTSKLIEALRCDDVDQTRQFSHACKDLSFKFSKPAFDLQVKEVQEYLKHHNDIRLKVRWFMYERFGYARMNAPDAKNTADSYLEIMKLASKLGDDQLLSDLYMKYVVICQQNERLYYLLKGIEIRERIGIVHFTDVSANYYLASVLLYDITNYRSSATYAARCINLFNESDKRDLLFQYILAADLAGASYLKSNRPDSAIYYYKHIDTLLNDRIAHPNRYKSPMSKEMLQIWKGVVKGGVGKAYILQKKYNLAYDLLLQNLKVSAQFKQWDNVAEVEISLGKIDQVHGNVTLALSRYLHAYRLALKSTKLSVLAQSAQHISSAFAIKKQYDSAYIYHKRYLDNNNKLDVIINQSRLDLVRTQVGFEKSQIELLQSQNNLASQKRIRNLILMAIAFLTVIALLLYNRKRLQLRLQNEKLEKEKQRAETEIRYAKQQIDFILHNIEEKNKIIKQLQTKNVSVEEVELTEMLNHFIILTDEDWRKFKQNFEVLNPNFLDRLKQKMPQLSQGEQRVLVLAKLGFSTKEMARATGVSTETIRSVMSRMRKKLNLDTDIHSLANEI